ncbi:MAG: non-heme iron oxygenase ferredoxin subunit [Planctomycetaceae bacterium]
MTVATRLAGIDEVPDGGRLSVVVDDLPALLLRVGDTYYCLEDVCSHDGQPLTDGRVIDGTIECARHGARFDICTGQVKCMPATGGIRVFEVETRDDGVYALV